MLCGAINGEINQDGCWAHEENLLEKDDS